MSVHHIMTCKYENKFVIDKEKCKKKLKNVCFFPKMPPILLNNNVFG